MRKDWQISPKVAAQHEVPLGFIPKHREGAVMQTGLCSGTDCIWGHPLTLQLGISWMLENTRTAQVLPKGEKKINKKNGSDQVFISRYLPVPIYSGVEHMGLVRARSRCWLCCLGKRNRPCICTLLYPPRARSIRGALTRRCHLGHRVHRWTLLPRTHCFLVLLCITFWLCPSHPQSFLNGKLCTLRSLCCIPCFTHCETMNNSSLPWP